MNINKDYTNRVSDLGIIDTVLRIGHPNCRIKRTYGWDCRYDDYFSNRHYNTQRHIDSIHGIGSGEPVDRRTGETREEKKKAFASDGNHNQSINRLAHPGTHSQSP